MYQHSHPGQRVLDPEPLPDQLGDPGQRPALILTAAGRQADVERRLPAGRQRPPPPVHRHPRHPEPPRDLPVAGAFPDQLRPGQPHLLAASRSAAVSPPPSEYLMILV